MSMETYTRLLMDASAEFPIHFLNIYSLTFPSIITPARGATRTITIGMYSGPRTEIVKTTIIKRLEEKHNVKILVDEGWTTTQLGRLRAGKNNPVHTMMWIDDIGVNIARKEGLIDRRP